MQVTSEKKWYLVQCKPKQDFRALENLQHQGYKCLLLTQQSARLRSGQLSNHEEPLFPGYLFIELNTLQDNWMPIRSTRGVSQIVRFGAEPLPVPKAIIKQLQIKASSFELTPKPGEKVIVNWPGTSGLEAIFLAKDGTERVILLLNILHRDIQITVPQKTLFK